MYDQGTNWSSINNRAARKVSVRVFICPSVGTTPRTAPDPSPTYPSAISDYAPIGAVSDKLCVFLGYTPATFPTSQRIGALETNKPNPLEGFRDGTSTTILLAEDADRPNRWRLDKLVGTNVTGAGWANDGAAFGVDGTAIATATVDRGSCVINCTNANEIYSFHTKGANVLFADGSIHYLRSGINVNVMVGLITKRNGGQNLPASEL